MSQSTSSLHSIVARNFVEVFDEIPQLEGEVLKNVAHRYIVETFEKGWRWQFVKPILAWGAIIFVLGSTLAIMYSIWFLLILVLILPAPFVRVFLFKNWILAYARAEEVNPIVDERFQEIIQKLPKRAECVTWLAQKGDKAHVIAVRFVDRGSVVTVHLDPDFRAHLETFMNK